MMDYIKFFFVVLFLFLSFALFWWFPPIFAICVGLAFYVLTEDLD